MQTISKRELFIAGWKIFKHNINFLVNIGILMFCMQVFIPMVLDSMFDVQNAQFFIYKLCYWVLTTGLTLGIIVQFLSIIRDEGEGNINDIVNYFHKLPASCIGSMMITLIFVGIGVVILFLFGVISDFNFNNFDDLTWSILSSQFIVGIIGYVVIVTYLSIKSHFFIYYIVDKDMGPIDAVKSSLLATNGYETDLFVVWIALAILNFLGIILFGLGLLFSLPYSILVLSVLYNKYFSKYTK